MSALVLLLLAAVLALPSARAALGFGAGQGSPAATTAAPTQSGLGAVATEAPATATVQATISPPIASDQCPDLRLFGFQTDGNTASWQMDNGTDQALVLEDMLDFGAPAANQSVESMQLGSDVIFMGPAVEGEFNWTDGSNRILAAGEVKQLTIEFAWEAEPAGYQMSLVFSHGCQLEGSW
jgi:hypothetical protein